MVGSPFGLSTLPMGLNRISWKQAEVATATEAKMEPLPMGLNRISWKH